MRTSRIKPLFLGVIVFFTIIGLTGCFKGEISFDVNGNGSGTMAVAFGMTQQAKALLANQGGSLSQAVEKNLNDNTIANPKVTVKNWIDGEYEWMKAEKKFETVDDVNNSVKGNELFKSFSLKQNNGLFQNEFILDAVLSAISDGTSSGGGFDVDPSAFIQMRFVVRLPGKIQETNGFIDADDPNKMIWTTQGKQTTSVKARSVAWNWLNISVMAIGAVLIGAVAFGVFGFTIYKPAKRTKQDLDFIVSNPISQQTDYLVSLDIGELLEQVNAKALNSAGQIHNRTGEIALIWKNAQGKPKFIDVKNTGDDQITINGQVYQATRDYAKKGILAALQQQNS